MGQIFNRINRLIKAELNYSKSDLETVLEQIILDMQEDLVQLRQAVASAVASQRLTKQYYKLFYSSRLNISFSTSCICEKSSLHFFNSVLFALASGKIINCQSNSKR